MKNLKNYYVSYWKNNDEMDVFYGTFAECEKWIDLTLEDEAVYQTCEKIIDYVPQPNW